MITWLGCDLVTGNIIEELPDLKLSGSIGRVLGTHTTAQFNMAVPVPGPTVTTRDWIGSTQPGRNMLVAVSEDNPIWAGIVLRRNGGTEMSVSLNAATLEAYFARRYVGDHTWTATDQATIAAGLIGDAQVEGIGFVVDSTTSGVVRDRTYFDKDNKSVFAALDELAGVLDGPEWTVDLRWSDSTQTSVDKIARVANRIGIASPAPGAVFETTASSVFGTVGTAAAEYSYDEDYSDGKGANHVVAYSSGQGDAQPFSDPARDETLLAGGWPRWEYRFQPSSSITDAATLNSHAQAKLAVIRLGGRTWAIDASATNYPRLGVDWNIGDDIAWNLIGHRHPDGVAGQARAIGWNLSPETERVSLVLWDPDDEEV